MLQGERLYLEGSRVKRWIDSYILFQLHVHPLIMSEVCRGIILSPQEASVEHSQEESRTELGKGKWP